MSLTRIAAAGSAVNVLPFPPDDVAHFVTGLLDGLVQDNDFDKIKPCLTDQEILAPELVEAINDFKKKDIVDIIKGVTVVGKMLSTLDKDLSDCAGMKPDLLRIKAWAVIFKDPIKLFRVMFNNTLMNIGKIHSDIGNIITDAETDKMHDLGENVADILVLQLGPIPKIEDYYFEVFGQDPAETLF